MKKRVIWIGVGTIGAVLLLVAVCNLVILISSKGRIYDDIMQIPKNRYGLLLGTSPITPRGTRNLYFDGRIKAASELYHIGKIEYIIASGGDYTAQHEFACNELTAMRDSLIILGVAPDKIILDYDGLRTINSIKKAKRLYGDEQITLISQKYHNYRALFQAKHFNLDAVAYNAHEPEILFFKIKNRLREYLARVKVFIDLL